MINLSITEKNKPKSFGLGPLMALMPTASDHDIVKELQSCIDEMAKPHPRCSFRLRLYQELITQPALALLVQLLNQPCTSQSSSTIEPNTIDATKWESVELVECRLAVPGSIADGEYCSPDDIQIFGSILALRTTSLELTVHDECPDILHAVCDAPKLEISEWTIEKRVFSALDCAKIASLLQRSERPLASLALLTLNIKVPPSLVEELVKITDKVTIGGFAGRNPNAQGRLNYPSLDNMLVGEGGNGMMQRLLQSPSSQVKSLTLKNVQLDDRHFMAIVDMLPTSQLESMCLLGSKVSWRGIVAFAEQLPRITCLQAISINFDKSERGCLETHRQEYSMALIKGMRDNYSIVKLLVPGLTDTPKSLLSHYVDLNDAGRRIFSTSKPVPAGLWPYILERAGAKFYGRFWWEYDSRRANAIYFFLRNREALFPAVH